MMVGAPVSAWEATLLGGTLCQNLASLCRFTSSQFLDYAQDTDLAIRDSDALYGAGMESR